MKLTQHRFTVFLLLAYAMSWWLLALDVPGFPVFPFGPDLAAGAVLALTVGRPGLHALIGRLRDWRVSARWLALAMGLPLGIAVTAVAALPLTSGPHTAAPDPTSFLEFFLILPLMVLVGGALGEELGWRGFALPVLQQRHHPVVAVAILTTAHLLWHLPLFLVGDPPLLVPFAVELAGGGLVLAWMANSHHSLWPVILTHGAHNMAQQAFMSSLNNADLLTVQWLTATGWLVAGAVTAVATRGRLGAPDTSAVPGTLTTVHSAAPRRARW